MSSPNSALGGGFTPYPLNTTLGYTRTRARSRSPGPSRRSTAGGVSIVSFGSSTNLGSVSAAPEDPHAPFGGFQRHRLRHGLSFDQVKTMGIISSHERSIEDFAGIDVCDEAIKSRPKKLRPYYENMAVIQEYYEEVDQLLAGELPSIIASTFASPPPMYSRSYSTFVDDDEHAHDVHSAWNVRPRRATAENGEEATELTPLMIAEREAARDRVARLALNVNTIVNILLVGAKGVAVWYSSSMSLTASLVDSALDLLSTFIILGTSWAIGVPTDRHLYPAGKRRFEPLGVLIFSVVMIASFVQVFIESAQRAWFRGDPEVVELSGMGMATMLATIGVKSVLWVWCSNIPSSGVQALAQDAENDVFFNIMSLAFPWIGHKLGWALLDPLGGMVLSAYIIIEWIKTLLQNFKNLSGRGASPDQYTRVLYLVSRFNPVISIADVECYHIGDDLIVEVDVILPNTSLHFAHDVGETIQVMLEHLDGVVRAYVHTDYTSKNPPQHTARTRQQSNPVLVRTSPDSSQPNSPAFASSATPTAANPFGQPVRVQTPKVITESPES